jgi:hypothetical protein
MTMCGRDGAVAVLVGVGVGVGVGEVVAVGEGAGVGLSVGVGVGEAVGTGTGSSAGLALTDAAHSNGTTETAAAISGISRREVGTQAPARSGFLPIKVRTPSDKQR